MRRVGPSTSTRDGATVQEEFTSADEFASAHREMRHDRRAVRLAELIHRLHIDPDRTLAFRNLFHFLLKELPDETLPILQRLAARDDTGQARFFYAKAALEKSQPKLAHRAIAPLLEAWDASDNVLLLGARVLARLGDAQGARALLNRIRPEAKLATGIAQVNALLGQVEHERNAV